MSREEYEAAVTRNKAALDAEKARVFGEQVPGVAVNHAIAWTSGDFPWEVYRKARAEFLAANEKAD